MRDVKKPGKYRAFLLLREGLSLLEAASTEALLELVDTTTSIQNLLGACVERVAGAANIKVNVLTHGGAGLDHVTA